MKETRICFLDIETSGLNPAKHEILEIAWILTDLNLKELDRVEFMTLPEHIGNSDPEALRINGFDSDLWAKEGVPLKQALSQLARSVPKRELAIPAGHNVATFDLPFIRKAFKSLNVFCPLSYHAMDTYPMSVAYSVASRQKLENFKLTTVAQHFGIEHRDAHTAMADVIASYEIFRETAGLLRIGYDACYGEGSGNGKNHPPEKWELIPTNKICSVCRGPQFDSPGGLVCKNGHGGADSLDNSL